MANHEINEEQEAVNKALRMIETSDPVHADIYNALFSVLINNDVFLEKLANKMVQQVMISHVMDSTNPDMVMGADQGPVITKLIEKIQDQITVLNTNQQKLITNLGNCKIITGSTGLITFEIWERKDIKVELGYPVVYFNFSFSGNGFEFETSADISADGNGAYIIAHNCGSRNANGAINHMKCNTTIHWIALVTT